MNRDFHFSVPQDQAGIRLDRLIHSRLPDQNISRSAVQEWIKAGLVRVDGSPSLKPSTPVQPGQKIEVCPGPSHQDAPEPVKGLVDIIFSDAHLLVLNKQPGLNVHPAPSVSEPTLVHHLLAEYPALKNFARQDRAGIVHRLDRDTSGLMLAALDPETAGRLQEQFKNRLVKKIYLALLCGCPEKKHGFITQPLGRDPAGRTRMAVLESGRTARTEYRIIHESHDKSWSLALIRIYTGRTHQIRVHMAAAGHPVMGDSVYGAQALEKIRTQHPGLKRLIKRQLLHSTSLEFSHPETRTRLKFFQPMPSDFQRVILHLSRKCQRIIITGSMGSGKSLVSSLLKELNHPVFDADQCVRELYQPGQDGWELIRKRFGNIFFEPETKKVDKRVLLEQMAENPAILEEINHLIHPLVRQRLESFFDRHKDCRT
ncbi:MAG: dephospho-CoA kinase, partial [Desulfonatronovibrionaceae bacterium]